MTANSKTTKSTSKTGAARRLTGIAMLSAVAFALQFLEFPIPIMPAFIKLDFSDLPELLAAGITSLKIEGRTKSAYYVGAVTNAYRHALDDAVAGRPLDPVWQREVLQISHRPYSTGFYFGQPGQYTANSAYFAGAEVCAVVEGTAPDGRAVLTQRNKFAVGDTLELVTNAAPPVTFTAQDLRDADGLPLESVPHPMQRFTMPLPCRAAPLSLVRRKLPAETVDIRLECGKI